MATKAAWDLNDHKRFARQFLPPGEFRDGYLEHLEEIEFTEPAEGEPTPRDGSQQRPGGPERGGASRDDEPRWSAQRYAVAAIGSVVFAGGTWLLTSLL